MDKVMLTKVFNTKNDFYFKANIYYRLIITSQDSFKVYWPDENKRFGYNYTTFNISSLRNIKDGVWKKVDSIPFSDFDALQKVVDKPYADKKKEVQQMEIKINNVSDMFDQLKHFKAYLIEEMKNGIDSVINGQTTSYINEFLPVSEFENYIKNKYGVSQKSQDSNGWQWDYWSHYKINGKPYTVEGCGYYGGTKFYIGENEEDDWEEEEEYNTGYVGFGED
jgi:hypothetical protein